VHDKKEKTRLKGEPMNEIAELERRIAYAMERIAKGVEALDKAVPVPPVAVADGGDAAELDALRTALAEERLANAQLEERVRAIKHKQEIQAANLITEQAATREKLSQLDSELSRLRKANEQLQSSNAALRAANESGVGEPHLINKSMMAELESMRAARQVDIAEAEAIKVALVPLLVAGTDTDETRDGETT
jgi:DNA repair exonuclease SbcCD ATPase subunit